MTAATARDPYALTPEAWKKLQQKEREIDSDWPTVKQRIVGKLDQLKRLDPMSVVAIEQLVTLRIEDKTPAPNPRTLDARLRAAHPDCGDTGFIQQPPRGGRRSWRCDTCGGIVTLDSE